jgi:vancomycin resistance protein YoaR
MVFRLPTALILSSLSLGLAAAQPEIPALPPRAPQEAPLLPLPLPQDAAKTSPEVATPPQPQPSPKAPFPRQDAPLLITVRAAWPAVIEGKKTTVPFVRTLTISGARVAQLRQRGAGITPSLEADLKAFVATLPSIPENARFEELWNGWAVVQRNGLSIDMAKTRSSIETVLHDPQGVQANIIVAGQIPPERTLNFFTSRSIAQHLGTGETNYSGSSVARVKNIQVGTRRFQDRLVEGNVVSFNQIVGPISTRTGFVTGLVIAGDRTANGVGGGICQVSTTVFRTLYGAGLPILERRNHSYQVRYYDPQGLDGTIYQPNLDLKFANDTGGALWFQAGWDEAESRLTIQVFGKMRDFTVEVGTPRTLRTTPALPDRLLPDANLPVGERQQVDWAAPGAVIEVTRQFRRNGQVFKQDVLKSTYRPWPNIFLVGTR